jgi:uncharacterized protein YbcV (DUF1398 family)
VASNRFSKPVAFNRTVVDDQKRLEHIGEQPFSTYVKELIDADIIRYEQLASKKDSIRIVQKTNAGGIKYVEMRR